MPLPKVNELAPGRFGIVLGAQVTPSDEVAAEVP